MVNTKKHSSKVRYSGFVHENGTITILKKKGPSEPVNVHAIFPNLNELVTAYVQLDKQPTAYGQLDKQPTEVKPKEEEMTESYNPTYHLVATRTGDYDFVYMDEDGLYVKEGKFRSLNEVAECIASLQKLVASKETDDSEIENRINSEIKKAVEKEHDRITAVLRDAWGKDFGLEHLEQLTRLNNELRGNKARIQELLEANSRYQQEAGAAKQALRDLKKKLVNGTLDVD